MDQQNEEMQVATDEARAGVTGHGVRYVLTISLALVIVALAALWLLGTRGGERSGTAATPSEAPLPAAT